jgi:hypothetical protein
MTELNSLPVSIKRTQAQFAQVNSMRGYYTHVLENLRPGEMIELTFVDEASRHRAHTSILSAGEKLWGRGRIKTSNTMNNHTVRIWFNPIYPVPDLGPIEQIKVPLENLETFQVPK